MSEIIAYTPKDAARALGIGLTSLYELIGAGLVVAKKAKGRTLIPAASLLAYLEALPAAEITTGQPGPKRAKGFQPRQSDTTD